MTLRDAFEVLSLSEKDLDPRSLEGVLTARLETAEFHDIPKLLEAYRTVNSLLETERWYWNPEMATNDQVDPATIEMRGNPAVIAAPAPAETAVQTRSTPTVPLGLPARQTDADDVELVTDEPAPVRHNPVRRPTVPLGSADVSIVIDDDAVVHPVASPVEPTLATPSGVSGFEESVRVIPTPQPDQSGVSARATEVSTRVIDPVRPVEPGRDLTLNTQLPPSQPSIVQHPITQPRVDLTRAVLTSDRDLEETTLVVVPRRRNLTAPLLVGVVALGLAGGLWAIQSSRAPSATTTTNTAMTSPKPPAVSGAVTPSATSGVTSRSNTSTDRPATAQPKPANQAPQTGSQTAPSAPRNAPAAKPPPAPAVARPKPTVSTAKPASTTNRPAAQPVAKPTAQPPVAAATKPVSPPRPVTATPSAPKPNANASRPATVTAAKPAVPAANPAPTTTNRPAVTAVARVAPRTVTPRVVPRAVTPPPSPAVSRPTARVTTTSRPTTVTRPTTTSRTTQRPRTASPPAVIRPAATTPTPTTPATTRPATPKPAVTASTPRPRPATTPRPNPRPQTPRPNTPTAAAVPAPVAVIEAPRSTGLPDNLTREEFGRRYFNQKLFEVWQRSGAELRYSSWEAVPLEIQTLDSRRFRAAVYIAPPPREQATEPGR